MKAPNLEQRFYSLVAHLEAMLATLPEHTPEFFESYKHEGVTLKSTFDVAHFSLKAALALMDEALEKSQEPKSVCF